MGGYWHESPDNPFNQMSYTRGGGGQNNDQTRESNERRAAAMPSGSVQALPRFANRNVAAEVLKAGEMAVVGERIVKKADPAAKQTAAKPKGEASEADGAPKGAAGPAPGKTARAPAHRLPVFSGVTGAARHPGTSKWDDDDPRLPKDTQLERIGTGGHAESMGAISEVGFYNTGTGYRPIPSADIKDRIEDGPLEWLWMLENYGPPLLGFGEMARPPWMDPDYSHYDDGLFGSHEWREGTRTRESGYRTGGGF